MKRRSGTSHHYILLFKPFGVVSQFTGEDGTSTLSALGPFPRSVYPVGRLDADSEGLLLLTDDTMLTHRLLEPRFGHPRTYLAQVEGIPDESALDRLRKGVLFRTGRTRPAWVDLLPEEPSVPPRPTPIRFRKTIPTSWIRITVTEGKNRQVRRMTAAVGHPTLRLVRTGLACLTLGDLGPGQWRELSRDEVRLLMNAVSGPAPSERRAGRSGASRGAGARATRKNARSRTG